MTFLADETRVVVLERMAAHLAPDGRVAIGFGANRGYEFDEFRADVADGSFPAEEHLVPLDPAVSDAFDRFLADPGT